MVAYIVMFPRARIVTLVFFFFISSVRIPAFLYLLMWIVFQLFSAPFGAQGGVAYLAHIGGFAIGLLFGAGYRVAARARTKFVYKTAKRSEGTPEHRKTQQILHPLRLEGITTSTYVEILVDMPGVNERDVAINISDNVVYVDAVTEDGFRRYKGKAIVRVKIRQQPEFVHYLNGILRIRIPRA